MALLGNSQDGQGKDFSYAIVSQLLAEKKDFAQALHVAHLIKGPGRLLDTLVRIAALEGKTGKRADASQSLAEALQVAEEMAKADPGEPLSLLTVAKAQLEVGETAETSAAASEFSAIARKRKEDGQGELLLQFLAAFQAELGDFSGAMQAVEQISGGAADWARGSIAEEYAKRGSLSEALGVATRISEPSTREGALSTIATAGRRSGNADEPLQAINTIQNPTTRSQALASLALDESRSHDPATYQSLLLWQATTEGGVTASDSARGTVVVTYGMMGDFANANQVLAKITQPEARQWPLWNLTRFLANHGKEQEALSLAEQEKNPLPRLYSILGTAEGILDRIEAETKSDTRNQQK